MPNRNRFVPPCAPCIFAWFDCSVIVVQEVGTLYDMWKSVNQSYVKAMARFTKSGEHGDDFYSFCAGALDVFYLRERRRSKQGRLSSQLAK
ncbi:hypothetical protein GN244_ATG13597 [Phytophthora infestans]|uniref:Uncharacterized protein n=1 Tax=Phytophthora infestans TaxID=4787 RepID=A0A833T650_PHYIN|nr:hypothetical protein GN244_ATG13597 [Phytophthora infestans]KAF4130779.1 hypothetical protein GN958_ATG20043 [Phytophthora infestans]